VGDPRFPHVLTTYRLTEHHTAGGMSRTLSHLSELQPELFAEISPELAEELGFVNGDWITVATLRGAVEARALVTRRMRPLQVAGRVVHQVAMPFHWGPTGTNTGDVVNDLIPISGEPNVTIHEGKALLCRVVAGRRAPDESFNVWLERELGADVADPHPRPETRRKDAGRSAEAGGAEEGGSDGAQPGGHGQEGKE